MKGVGDKVPDFDLIATIDINSEASKAFKHISTNDLAKSWYVLFFWPKDFTFVCPTEIVGFAEIYPEFKARKCELLGCSTDSEYVHRAWRESHPQLRNLPFPMLADIKRELSSSLGILDRSAGVAQRATYIVDPEGIIRFVSVTDLNVGRNPQEVLRVLDALQSDKLTPCNWQPGESTLN
jgi:peroxiredoxin (alkyl hydroperoxide reductase subunit C)